MSFIWGITFFGMAKFFIKFSKDYVEDKKPTEIYNRLLTVFTKNKMGYNTRIFSDFDMMLEALLNERFIDESTKYYDNPNLSREIEDLESGLNGDMSEADLKLMLKDNSGGHHESKLCMKYPGRFGTKFEKTDDLSIYKVHPKGYKPQF